MKFRTFLRLSLPALALALLLPAVAVAAPQFGSFTYQGFLEHNGSPVNGERTLTFRLFDQASGGTQIGPVIERPNWPVANGIVTVDLNVPGAFNGQQRFLEVTVNGAVLTPRQPVMAVPVALHALSAPVAPPPTPSLSCTTVLGNYQGTYDLSCPAGHVAVTASCNDGLATVYKDSTMPPLSPGATLVWYLTPNAANATGVRCRQEGSARSHALLRCCRVAG